MYRPLSVRTSPRMPTPASERQMIEEFWRKKNEEIEAIEDFGERAIPMTRLRKIIGAEKGKMLMTFDTPSFLTKACEIFVQELAFRAWMCASSHHRSVILDTDIAQAIATTESYDFLKDTLHAFREENNSVACSKPAKKHHRSIYQSSTSHHSPLNQVPQFHPQFAQYPPVVRIPHPLLPTNVHPMSLSFPFPLLQQVAPPLMSTTVTPTPIATPTMMSPLNYMAMGSGLFGNGTNTTVPSNFVMSNNIAASGVMTHSFQVHADEGDTINIPSTSFYMNMTNASALSYDVGGASNNNTAALSQFVAMEQDHILPVETAQAASMMHAYDTTNANDNADDHQEQQTNLDDVQQEQQVQVDGTSDVVVASAGATDVVGDNCNVSCDEFVIPDDSFMSAFWEEIMMVDSPTPLPDVTTSTDLLTSDTQDIGGSHDDSNLCEDLSPTEAQGVAGSLKAPI